MRKIFTSLKAVVAAALVASMTLAASCSYDDSAINNRVDKVEKDLAALTERVAALEARVGEHAEALAAFADGKVVVDVKVENGDTTVTLSDGTSFVIPAPVADTDTDTNTTVAPAKDADGVYYWAIYEGGEFVKFLEVENAKVPVYAEAGEGCDCVPAELKFSVDAETGNLLVSIDGGATWVDSGVSTKAVSGACIFTDVVVNDDNTVTFVMVGGDEFTVAKAELIECEATRSQVYVKAGETKAIPFAINDAVEDINVMNQPLGWKASVESTRAVGGMDFVLNVTAPSKEFLATGFAEKEGVVSVHFNTAAGACKVMNVTVNLAELSIAVDKAGNITIKNSVLDYYEGYDNLTYEPYEYENFVTWYIGVLPIQSFNGTITEDVMDDSVLGTYGWMFGVDDMPYVEGEYELQVVETSLQWMFENINYEEMSTTESYVVYLVPFADGGKTPVFEDAVYTSFKQLNVAVEEVEAYYNDVLLNVTFAGAEKYHITAVAESDLEWYDGIEGYIQENIMMYFAYNHVQFANTIEEDFFGKEISLRGLIDYGVEPWYSVLPNETYYLIVLPIEDSSVAYTDYVLEDFRYYSFETLDIVEAAEPIEHTATFVDEDSSALGISVQVSYDTEVVDYAYYKWYTEEQLDLTKEELLLGNKVSLDYPVYESCSAPGEQKVLAVLLVNKNGEYTIAQHTFHSKDIAYSDAVISFESVTFEGEYINVTIAGAENVDFFRYYVNAVDVANTSEEFLAPLAYKTISGGKTAYTNPFSQMYTANWSKFAEGNTYFIALVAVFKDGTVTKPITGEFTYEAKVVEPEEPAEVTVVSAAATHGNVNGDMNYHVVNFTLSNGVVYAIDMRTNGNPYLPVGEYTTDWSTYNRGQAAGYIYVCSKIEDGNKEAASCTGATVSYADDKYTVVFNIYNYDTYALETYTYVGAIEGLEAPVIEEGGDEPEEPEQPEGGDDANWADAITLTNISIYKQVENALGFSTNYCYFYTLSDESGDNAVTIFACDYFFSTSWLEAATYQYVDPYFANNANQGDYKFSAYEVKVNGVNVELSYESSATGTLVITNPDTDTYTFKCAVPGADGKTYKFTTGNLKLEY